MVIPRWVSPRAVCLALEPDSTGMRKAIKGLDLMDMVLDTTLTVFTKIIHMMNITQKATGLMLDSMITATTHIHAMVKDGPIVHTQWST